MTDNRAQIKVKPTTFPVDHRQVETSFDFMAQARGYQRKQGETLFAPSRARRFEAARINRLNDDAPISNAHINADLRREGSILIARARWLHQNDGYTRRALSTLANNIIGANGIELSPMIPSKQTGEIEPEINDAVVRAWKRWGRKGSVEKQNKFSWRKMQKAQVINAFRDGESFLLMTMGRPTAANPFGFWLRFIDPVRVPFDCSEPAPNGNAIRMGIEFNADDVPVAYYVQTNDPNTYDYSYHGRKFVRYPAERIIHYFDPEFPEQIRGFSGLVGAMRDLPMLDGYMEAALVNARVGASKTGIVQQTGEALGDYTGDEDDEADEDQDFIEEISPGIVSKIPRGWEWVSHDPAFPSQTHGDFIKPILRRVASSVNVSYHSIANDLEGINLSSIRHGVQEDRESYKGLQEDVIDANRPIYEQWLLQALGRGQINPGNGAVSLSSYERLAQNVEYQPRGWEFAEPQKDANANLLNLKMRTTTPSEIIRRTGRDPKKVFAEYAKDVEQLQALGIPLSLDDVAPVDTPADDEEPNQQPNGGANNAP